MKFSFLTRGLLLSLLIGLLTLLSSHLVQAQTSTAQTYSTGVVTQILDQSETTIDGQTGYMQSLEVKEDKTNQDHQVQVGSDQNPTTLAQTFKIGQKVVLIAQADQTGQIQYMIADQYRLPGMVWLMIGFFIVVLVVSRWKGATSLLSLFLSMGILLWYMVPQISQGTSPVVVSVIAAGIISALIIYLSHGFSYRSHVALACMLLTLAMVALLSHFIIQLMYLNGNGDETASYLQLSGLPPINLQGLLLGGIILAALSVLDDSVVSQVSVIAQLKEVKPDITVKELFKRGMAVGQDHISTLVNTLVLAYAGSSLPLFILFTLAHNQPIWVSLNDQMIAEEVVRTLTGSIGLVLSIPLTTFVAAQLADKLQHKVVKPLHQAVKT